MTETYQMSDEDKSTIIEEDKNLPSINDMTTQLKGNQMNSEMKQAWISTIVPPEENYENAPNTDNEIAVEFMLPSGLVGEETHDDKFWKKFDFPQNRWPEDNEFRQFMEYHGYYSIDSIPELVGESVDIQYNDIHNKWLLDENYKTPRKSGNNAKYNIQNITDNVVFKGIVLLFILIISGFTIVFLRHIGVILVGLALSVGMVYYFEQKIKN